MLPLFNVVFFTLQDLTEPEFALPEISLQDMGSFLDGEWTYDVIINND